MRDKRGVSIIETEVANIASVEAGLIKAGGEPSRISDPERVLQAERVVLPGVGTFGASMDTIRALELDEPLRKRIAEGRPTLMICVGFQLLFETSSESPGAFGLGVLPGKVERFPDGVRVPQFGWNKVTPFGEASFLKEGYAYFANSYRATDVPEGWTGAFSENGGQFIAALERGAVLACQFHPELSSTWGIELLRRWLESN